MEEGWGKVRRRLIEEFWTALEGSGELWLLRAHDGMIPWEDALGRVTIPLWPSQATAAAAAEEAAQEPEFEPGDEETPAVLPLSDLPTELERWFRKGVEVVFLNPLSGRAPLTLTIAEFADAVLLREAPQMSEDARQRLAALAGRGES